MFGLKNKTHLTYILLLTLISGLFITSVILTITIPKQYEEYTVEYAHEVRNKVGEKIDSKDINKEILALQNEYSFDVMIFDEETLEYTSNDLLYNLDFANEVFKDGYVYKGNSIVSGKHVWIIVYESDLSDFVNDALMRNLLLFTIQALLMIVLLIVMLRKTLKPLARLVEIINALRSNENTFDSNEELDEISEELIRVSNSIKLRLFSSQNEEKEYERKYLRQEHLILEQRNHLANVVHDVKGTFSAINFSAQCIANVKALSEEEKLALQNIEVSSTAAREYITKTLNSVIANSVDIYIDKDEINIKKYIEDFFTFNNLLLLEKSLKIEINGGVRNVVVNVLKFNYVVNNVLSNMIKYSKKNSTLVVDIFDDKCVFTNEIGEINQDYSNYFGLKSIKSSVKDIGFDFDLSLDEKVAVFTLYLGDDLDV